MLPTPPPSPPPPYQYPIQRPPTPVVPMRVRAAPRPTEQDQLVPRRMAADEKVAFVAGAVCWGGLAVVACCYLCPPCPR